jgi:hypothetical protein
MAEVLPPTILRFLFLRHRPNRAIEFDPAATPSRACSTSSTGIADAVAGRPVKGELPPDPERIFALSLVDPDADVRHRGGALPAALRPPGAAAAGARPGHGRAPCRREGCPLDSRERTWHSSASPPRGPGSSTSRRPRPLEVHYDELPRRTAAELDADQRATWPRSPRPPRSSRRPAARHGRR